MKKRKITYDMSARQKKELKRQQESGNKGESVDEGQAVRPQKRGLIVALTAGALAVVLIVLAFCIPAMMPGETVTNETFTKWSTYNSKDPENPYNDENPNPNPPANPIVTFTLYSDNKAAFKNHFGADEITINYELFIDDAPYSSINMLYLAESGFYDETIINDVKKGYAMINGFTDTTGNNKAKDLTFVEKLSGFGEDKKSRWENSGFKLGYRFSAETKRRDDDSPLGYLIMLAGTYSSSGCTSTGYVFITRESPQFDELCTYMSWVGKLTADDGENQDEKLALLNNVPTETKGKFSVPQFAVKIKSAQSNLSSARRKYLLNNFESIIKDGCGASWKTNSYNSSDYNF